MAKEKQTREEVLARVPASFHELVNWEKTLSSDSNIYIKLPESERPSGETVCGYVSASKSSQVNFEFCMRVPSGATVEELNASALEMYGIDLPFLLRTAVLSFSRSADDKAKPELFDGHEPTPEKHAAMQARFASWKPGEREKAAVSPDRKAAKILAEVGDMEIVYLQAFLLGKMSAEHYKLLTGRDAPSKEAAAEAVTAERKGRKKAE